MKVFTDFCQYSPEYWDHRMGHPSASNFDRIITPSTGKFSKGSEKYINELLAEFIIYTPNFFTEQQTVPENRPQNRGMEEGIKREPESRKWYAFEKVKEVEEVGGCLSDCGRWWSSPDGLIGEREGVLELKNPDGATQIKYLLDGGLPEEYRPQCHAHLMITELPYCDFVSYHPSMPGLIVRVEPNEYTRELRVAGEMFWSRYEAAAKRLGVFERLEKMRSGG